MLKIKSIANMVEALILIITTGTNVRIQIFLTVYSDANTFTYIRVLGTIRLLHAG